uniref:Uncharacterized protein n=1 Tax=Cacopsylla melanoneura TaxID=428564 RepID=A0A8D9BJZ2_9HEMI
MLFPFFKLFLSSDILFSLLLLLLLSFFKIFHSVENLSEDVLQVGNFRCPTAKNCFLVVHLCQKIIPQTVSLGYGLECSGSIHIWAYHKIWLNLNTQFFLWIY